MKISASTIVFVYVKECDPLKEFLIIFSLWSTGITNQESMTMLCTGTVLVFTRNRYTRKLIDCLADACP
jgi:hypothetical protein